MEIKVQKTDLSEGLAWIQSVVDRKTTMPILSNVLLEAKGKGLTMTATDLEVGVKEIMPAEVLQPGRAAIPARGLYDVVKEFPNQLVTLKILENQWVHIQCAKSEVKLV